MSCRHVKALPRTMQLDGIGTSKMMVSTPAIANGGEVAANANGEKTEIVPFVFEIR